MGLLEQSRDRERVITTIVGLVPTGRPDVEQVTLSVSERPEVVSFDDIRPSLTLRVTMFQACKVSGRSASITVRGGCNVREVCLTWLRRNRASWKTVWRLCRLVRDQLRLGGCEAGNASATGWLWSF